MSRVVIDASAALAWVLQSQSTPAASSFLAARGTDRFVAPYIFRWEVGNVLIGLRRRNAVSPHAHARASRDLDDLRIEYEEPHGEAGLRALGRLALERGLTLFDAAYIDLALEQSLPLASRDDRMLAVATAEGIACIDLRGDQQT